MLLSWPGLNAKAASALAAASVSQAISGNEEASQLVYQEGREGACAGLQGKCCSSEVLVQPQSCRLPQAQFLPLRVT